MYSADIGSSIRYAQIFLVCGFCEFLRMRLSRHEAPDAKLVLDVSGSGHHVSCERWDIVCTLRRYKLHIWIEFS